MRHRFVLACLPLALGLTAVLFGPVDAGIAGVVDPALPLDGVVDEVGRADRAVVGGGMATMLGDPRPRQGLEVLDLDHAQSSARPRPPGMRTDSPGANRTTPSGVSIGAPGAVSTRTVHPS